MVQAKKTREQIAAEACGMTIEQFRAVKAQTTAARQRGKRPAGTAGAAAKLAGWGEVDGQEQLFACEPEGSGA
ncbi:hypothetical protein [Amycolatopsis australiensis]|uniref:Uncharacterized protein n=1 Tax=Amycolatopsis australiensis TaxID=546364 RepID=A0A1K1PRP1_9PSEU|nr:hypothetical protein [Amycolatopsis australiensis]SFW50327.1 hypothetical protein SAMN04489730_0937 [Amycolatopsis australiensis]